MSLTIIDYLVKTNEDWLDGMFLDDGAGPPVAHDLTGSSFKAHIRTEPDSLTVVLECSTDNGRLLISSDPETGGLSWNVMRAEMRLIEPGVYHYDMVWTRPGGYADTVIAGTVTVERGITR
jgi:hypothetical protein